MTAKRHQPVRIVSSNMTLFAKAVHLSKRSRVFVLSDTRRLKKLVADARALIVVGLVSENWRPETAEDIDAITKA